MEDIATKSTGDQLSATEWNQPTTETENAIKSAGITLSVGDLEQLAKALSVYANGGNYYTDSGTANSYVLGVVGLKKAPPAYFTGMQVRFRPGNNNTIASTVNVASLGVKNIKKSDGATDPAASDINLLEDCILTYDGTNFRLPYKALNLPKWNNSILISNDTDTLHDIKFAAGKCRDSADSFDIVLPTDLVRQIDVAYGTGNGGLPAGVSLSSGPILYPFVISKPDGTSNAGFDSSLTATNLLAVATGYTKYRRVGWFKLNASSEIINASYTLVGGALDMQYNTKIADFSSSVAGTTTPVLSVPTAFSTKAIIECLGTYIATNYALYLKGGKGDEFEVLDHQAFTGADSELAIMPTSIWTTNTGTIQVRSVGTVTKTINTLGCIDPLTA
jgi:hypothetical protein